MMGQTPRADTEDPGRDDPLSECTFGSDAVRHYATNNPACQETVGGGEWAYVDRARICP